MGTTSIAHKLTDMGIPISSIDKNVNMSNMKAELNDGNRTWRPQTVKSILENEIYLGHMIEGK